MDVHQSLRSAPAARAGATGTRDAAALAVAAADLSTERLARGATHNLFGAAAERGLGIAITITLPAVLAPVALGGYYEVAALLGILTIVAVFGLDVGVTRFTALLSERGQYERISRYARSGLMLSAAWAVGLAASVEATAPWLARTFGIPSLVTPLRIGALYVPAMSAAALLVAPSKGLKRMVPAVLAIQVIQPGTQLALTAALLSVGRLTLGTAVAALAASSLFALATAAVLGRTGIPPVRRTRGTAARATGLVRFSLPAGGTTLMGTGLLWVDTLLLGAYRSPREVAVYGLVVRLLTANAAILLAVVQILGPFAAQLVERKDVEGLRQVLQTATRWVTTLSGPFLALLLLLATRLVTALHQPGATARRAVPILCAAFLVDAMTGPVAQVLTMSGRPALNFANNAGGLAVNVALNLVLIPRLGIDGAAIAWAIAILGINAARLIEIRVLLGIGPFGSPLWKPAAAVGVAFVAGLAALRWTSTSSTAVQLAGTAVAFVAGYAAALRALRLPAEDRTLFRAMVSGRSPVDALRVDRREKAGG